jgi:hypothetical protein
MPLKGSEVLAMPENKTYGGMKSPLILLCLFVFIITINSGLMYQVINPAFEHLTGLVSWYWASFAEAYWE